MQDCDCAEAQLSVLRLCYIRSSKPQSAADFSSLLPEMVKKVPFWPILNLYSEKIEDILTIISGNPEPATASFSPVLFGLVPENSKYSENMDANLVALSF